MAQALPEANTVDARMKKIFMNNCTGLPPAGVSSCSFRFDEAAGTR